MLVNICVMIDVGKLNVISRLMLILIGMLLVELWYDHTSSILLMMTSISSRVLLEWSLFRWASSDGNMVGIIFFCTFDFLNDRLFLSLNHYLPDEGLRVLADVVD